MSTSTFDTFVKDCVVRAESSILQNRLLTYFDTRQRTLRHADLSSEMVKQIELEQKISKLHADKSNWTLYINKLWNIQKNLVEGVINEETAKKRLDKLFGNEIYGGWFEWAKVMKTYLFKQYVNRNIVALNRKRAKSEPLFEATKNLDIRSLLQKEWIIGEKRIKNYSESLLKLNKQLHESFEETNKILDTFDPKDEEIKQTNIRLQQLNENKDEQIPFRLQFYEELFFKECLDPSNSDFDNSEDEYSEDEYSSDDEKFEDAPGGDSSTLIPIKQQSEEVPKKSIVTLDETTGNYVRRSSECVDKTKLNEKIWSQLRSILKKWNVCCALFQTDEEGLLGQQYDEKNASRYEKALSKLYNSIFLIQMPYPQSCDNLSAMLHDLNKLKFSDYYQVLKLKMFMFCCVVSAKVEYSNKRFEFITDNDLQFQFQTGIPDCIPHEDVYLEFMYILNLVNDNSDKETILREEYKKGDVFKYPNIEIQEGITEQDEERFLENAFEIENKADKIRKETLNQMKTQDYTKFMMFNVDNIIMHDLDDIVCKLSVVAESKNFKSEEIPLKF
jgi:hypothetical protein